MFVSSQTISSGPISYSFGCHRLTLLFLAPALVSTATWIAPAAVEGSDLVASVSTASRGQMLLECPADLPQGAADHRRKGAPWVFQSRSLRQPQYLTVPRRSRISGRQNSSASTRCLTSIEPSLVQHWSWPCHPVLCVLANCLLARSFSGLVRPCLLRWQSSLQVA